MKLVEILARELEQWPEGSHCACQDNDGKTFLWTGEPDRAGDWIDNKGAEIHGRLGDFTLASDHSTAIITREMWEAERARIKGEKAMPKANKDGWMRHLGGKQPRDAIGIVEFRLRNGVSGADAPMNLRWSHLGSDQDVMAWKPHKPEQVIVSDASVLTDGLREPEMPAKYFDGPLQWRDRITEINRQMADLRAEKAGLVVKLSEEGFALIGEQPF